MRTTTTMALAALLTTACSSTDFGMNQQVASKNISISAVAGQPGTYQIEVLNVTDFDWDGDRPEDRQKAVNFFLGKQCSSTQIISDTPVPSGTYPFTTKPRIKHTMLVKCQPRG